MSKHRSMSITPWLLLSALWTGLFIIVLLIGLGEYKKHIYHHAEAMAQASYQTDLNYRRWAAAHGGVYVPVSKDTPPSLYLRHLKERDISTPDGQLLTLINPDYMARQVREMAQIQTDTHGHLTSLTPIRPENAADPWETKNLRQFNSGHSGKITEILEVDGRPVLRAMYPMITEPDCLKCHAEQNYQVGDVRGGLSYSVPLDPYLVAYQRTRNSVTITLALLWAIGLGLSYRAMTIIRRQFSKLEKSRQRAADAEARYRNLFGGAEYGIAIVDQQNGQIIEANRKLSELIDRPLDEINGAPQSLLPDIADLQTSMTGKEIELTNGSGETLFVEVKKRVIMLAGKRAEEILFYDRSEQKKQERQILASAQRIRDIFQATQNVAFVIAAASEGAPILEFSPGAEQIFGYQAEDVIGKPVAILHAPDTNIPDLQSKIHSNKIAFSGRINLRRKTGQVFPALFTLYPLFDENENLYGGLGVSIDISELKELEERLSQTQKMEAIGTLAGGIAHDFNNILSIIFGYTQLLARYIEPDTKAFKHLTTIEGAATRAKDLVSQILTFSRKSVEKKQQLSLAPIIKEALKMLRATLPKTITITEDIDPNCGKVIADPTQMHQVLMNLCTNAYQAMRKTGGTIRVLLQELTIDPDLLARHPELTSGDYLLLQIEDTGPGIDDDVLPRIFDPFFTTKATEKGTGMGLAVVHGIIQNHGGVILVTTKAEAGSCFSIYLPKVKAPAEAGADKISIKTHGHERILMVDDEPLLAALGHDLLTALGYQVKISTDSRKALERFRAAPDSFDLVVTDQTMPFMTGAELTVELLKIRPDLPVIICTGFSDLINQTNYHKYGAGTLLSKPLEKGQLGRAIRALIDGE